LQANWYLLFQQYTKNNSALAKQTPLLLSRHRAFKGSLKNTALYTTGGINQGVIVDEVLEMLFFMVNNAINHVLYGI
jgi:hypothetical protein